MKLFTHSIIGQLIGSMFMVAAGGGSAVEKRTRPGNKGADKPQHMRDAISKGKEGGELVLTLEQEAEQEAEEGVKELGNRMSRCLRIFRTYGTTDWPKVEKYPDMVRQEYAKKMGFDMSGSPSDWPDAHKFLYKNFIINQVQPFQIFIDLANMKVRELADGTKVQDPVNGFRVGVGPIIKLLEEPVGSFAAKVKEARVLLGKPTRARKAKGPDQNGNHGTAALDAEKGAEGTTTDAKATTGKLPPWDMADLKKKQPVEVCILLVAHMPYPDVMRVIQACSKRLRDSDDSLDALAAERLEKAYKEYLTKNDAGDNAPTKKQQAA